MKELINQRMQPVVLSDGTVLSASGTPGSSRKVESLSEADETRLVKSGIVTVREVEFTSSAAAENPKDFESRPSTVAKKEGN